MLYRRSRAAGAVLLAVSAALSGCSNSDDGNAVSLKQNMQTQQDIIVQSGGDWNKLSPANRAALIKGPGYGNEAAARAYFAATYDRQTHTPTTGPPAVLSKPPGQ